MNYVPDFFPILKKTEWEILNAIPDSPRKIDLARKVGIGASHVNYILTKFSKIFLLKGIFNYQRMGLIPLVVISRRNKRKIPTYTLLVSEITGIKKAYIHIALVPIQYIDVYVNLIDSHPLEVIRGIEFRHWSPSSPFIEYVPLNGKNIGYLRLIKNFSDILSKKRIKGLFNPIKLLPQREIKIPDHIDAAIIFERMKDPFISPKKAIENAARHSRKYRKLLKKKSLYKIVGYHFHKHVLKLYWKRNMIVPLLPENVSPTFIAVIEGFEHAVVARIFSYVPGVRGVFIDKRKSLLVYQPFPYMQFELAKLVNKYDIDSLKLYVHTNRITDNIDIPLYMNLEEKNEKFYWKKPFVDAEATAKA
ncbi:MAG: hypothetical protein DRJ35_01695 [Thermoprotei archaeon]|nr:MAG: hypothetical protein DRJ35_01695 [Thermoprotei archaeon]